MSRQLEQLGRAQWNAEHTGHWRNNVRALVAAWDASGATEVSRESVAGIQSYVTELERIVLAGPRPYPSSTKEASP